MSFPQKSCQLFVAVGIQAQGGHMLLSRQCQPPLCWTRDQGGHTNTEIGSICKRCTGRPHPLEHRLTNSRKLTTSRTCIFISDPHCRLAAAKSISHGKYRSTTCPASFLVAAKPKFELRECKLVLHKVYVALSEQHVKSNLSTKRSHHLLVTRFCI